MSYVTDKRSDEGEGKIRDYNPPTVERIDDWQRCRQTTPQCDLQFRDASTIFMR